MDKKTQKMLLEITKIHLDRNAKRGDTFVPIEWPEEVKRMAIRRNITHFFQPASKIKVDKYGNIIQS